MVFCTISKKKRWLFFLETFVERKGTSGDGTDECEGTRRTPRNNRRGDGVGGVLEMLRNGCLGALE